MLISQKYQAGFVHIPKCGGSTIRHQFAAMADTETRFDSVADHPALGRVFLSHLPLWAIRTHYPDTFALLERFRLFAICRDPFDRFESALSQRLTFLQGKRINDFAYPEVLRMTREITAELAAADRLVSADLCHFIPQSDFIFLDGVQVVENVYPLGRIDDLAAKLSAITGIPAAPGLRSNQTLDFRMPQSEATARRISGLSRRLLPRQLHATLKRGAKALLTRGGSRYKGFARTEPWIAEFVRGFYARDLALHAEITASAETRP